MHPQCVLTVPDRGCVSGVTRVILGGKGKDTLHVFCMTRIWKRQMQQHALAEWRP